MPDSDTPPEGLLRGGRYVYDPDAIRPRHRGEAASAVQGESSPRER